MDLQLLSQSGSTYNCLRRSVPEIHSHVAWTLSKQATNQQTYKQTKKPTKQTNKQKTNKQTSSQPPSPFRQRGPATRRVLVLLKKNPKQTNKQTKNPKQTNKQTNKKEINCFAIVIFDLCVFLRLSRPLLSDNWGQVHAMFLSCFKKKKKKKFTVLLSSCLTCACLFVSATLSFQTTGARCTPCSCLA